MRIWTENLLFQLFSVPRQHVGQCGLYVPVDSHSVSTRSLALGELTAKTRWNSRSDRKSFLQQFRRARARSICVAPTQASLFWNRPRLSVSGGGPGDLAREFQGKAEPMQVL